MKSQEELENGVIILIDKPINLSSFSVVNKIRNYICKIYKIKKIKIGHAGTLDPKATGLLVLATGKFTKKISILQEDQKTYIGTLKLGAQTSSYDSETKEMLHKSIENISKEIIINQTKNFIGEINQVPPMYSAIKKNGIRMFYWARKGININILSRKITIYNFKIDKIYLPFVDFEIQCSKGTYIRTLAKDFGDNIGCGAYLTKLRRTKSGNFHINQAYTIEQILKKLKIKSFK